MDVLQIIKREEKYGKDMYDVRNRQRIMTLHCSKTVPNENGTKRNTKKCFLFLEDNVVKNLPTPRLMKNPTVSEKKSRIIDEKYNSHMCGNNAVE
ncbi:TPA: hypothetical protein ROX88_003275 [Bacillus pseudomycoides]|nr:hypothetical protein [Bacillus pseudomycoides]